MNLRRVLILVLTLMLVCSGLVVPQAEVESVQYAIGVDLTNQIVTVYNAYTGEIVRQLISSCGAKRTPTVTGTFLLPAKRNREERSPWYHFIAAGGYAHFVTRIFEGYMFHSYLYNSSYEGSLIVNTVAYLGVPVSHGCIRMRPEDAKWIAKNCPPGTRVKIYKRGKRDEYLRHLLKRQSFYAADGVSYTDFVHGATSDAEVGYGTNEEVVEKLQNRLLGLGLYDGDISGIYTIEMYETITALQQALGLEVTGKVNKGLWDLIFSDDAPTSSLARIGLGAGGPMVSYVQALLKKAALYNGEITGVFDAETDAAVRKYQNYAGVPVDGVLTDAQRLALIDLVDELAVRFPDGYALKPWTETVRMATVETRIGLNIRKEKSLKAGSLAEVVPKTVVQVLEDDGEWSTVSWNGVTGYVLSKYIQGYNDYVYGVEYVDAPNPELVAFDEKAWAVQPLLTCVEVPVAVGKKADNMVFYREKKQDAKVAFALLENSRIDLVSVAGGWAEANYCGVTGYIRTTEVNLTTRRVLSASVPAGEVQNIAVNNSGAEIPVYDNVSVNSGVLGTLAEGAEVELVIRGDTWSQISYNGGAGYVQNSALQINEVAPALRVYREMVIGYLSETGSIPGAAVGEYPITVIRAINNDTITPEVNLDATEAEGLEEFMPWNDVSDDFMAELYDPAEQESESGRSASGNIEGIDTSAARAAFDAADQEDDR